MASPPNPPYPKQNGTKISGEDLNGRVDDIVSRADQGNTVFSLAAAFCLFRIANPTIAVTLLT
ncbi:hypothetical protein E4U58_001211 [Claviceps cyperi]|nr:hypothetical protein E4U58_001211 [Claviceps cyperi]